MFLRQVFDPHLAQYAYVIGCQKTGEAIVIDPLRDIGQYQAIAAAEGLKLNAVAETHIHADFVSGARELSVQGADVYVSAEGGSDWQSEWAIGLPKLHLLHDKDTFRIGNIKLQALHTPGHTPEHLSFLVTDEGGGANEPMGLITGDFLFVGDVGRPDLLEQAAGISGTQELGAKQLYHSLKKLNELPDYLQILPAHGAGSACGKSLGAVPTSTLGYEKKFNHALRLALHGTEDAFVHFILDGQPEPPLYFANMKKVNKIGPVVLGDLPPLAALDISKVIARINEPDFVVLDTRSDNKAFASCHLKGSLYAPVNGDFSGLAGSYLSQGEMVVLIIEDPAQADGLARQLRRIGVDQVLGFIPLVDIGKLDQTNLASIPTAKFTDLEALLRASPNAIVLDVRRATEYAAGHVRDSVNIAHTRLRKRSGELPRDVPLIVHCQSGKRAIAAVAWLQRDGHKVTYVNDTFNHVPITLLA